MTGVDRQALFEGTEAVPDRLALDTNRLRAYLREHVAGFDDSLEIKKFRGGQSNPTYKLTSRDRSFVLRRKPPGALLSSAHAIDREFRVITALHRVGFPVPRPYVYCADEAVVGTPFYIAEYVEGRVLWNADMPGVSPADRTVTYDGLNRCLADLHRFSITELGLGDFGRPGHYMSRSLDRWTKQYQASKLIDIADMDWLMSALRERLPKEEKTSLVHGDYGLYNVLLHPHKPEVIAVLDWEVSTIGDPLADLAWHTRPWWDLPDPHGSATSLVGLDLKALCIPSQEEYIVKYCSRAGIEGFEHRSFYISYSQFRYAAIIQGILKRALDGVASNKTMLHTQERVVQIAAMARHTLTSSD